MSGIKLVAPSKKRGSVTSFLSPKSQFFKSSFHGVPKGGLEIQSEKQYSPSEVTDEGIFMDVKPLQPEKHQPHNEVIDEVISMDFNPLLF